MSSKDILRGKKEGVVVSMKGGHMVPAARWYTKIIYLPWELREEAESMAKALELSDRALYTKALIAGLKWVAWSEGLETDKLKGVDMELVDEAVTGVFRDEVRKKQWLTDTLAAEMNRWARAIRDD